MACEAARRHGEVGVTLIERHAAVAMGRRRQTSSSFDRQAASSFLKNVHHGHLEFVTMTGVEYAFEFVGRAEIVTMPGPVYAIKFLGVEVLVAEP